MVLTSCQVRALRNLSIRYGEAIGMAEGLAWHLEDGVQRQEAVNAIKDVSYSGVLSDLLDALLSGDEEGSK